MTFGNTTRIKQPAIFIWRLLFLCALLLCAIVPTGLAQDDFDFSNRSLFVDTSNIGRFQCGQFYVLDVYEEYFVEAGGPPKYRLYGELILYKACVSPLPSPERGDFPVDIVQAINCIKKCPEGPCGCDIGFTKAPFSLLRIGDRAVVRDGRSAALRESTGSGARQRSSYTDALRSVIGCAVRRSTRADLSSGADADSSAKSAPPDTGSPHGTTTIPGSFHTPTGPGTGRK